MATNNYFYDENHTRYQLIKSKPGDAVYNWIFLPGGPGIDSNYLLYLIDKLDVSGNYWLIDLPSNGSNELADLNPNINKRWGEHLISAVNIFDNPILVGHSFGGNFPLFFPQLEKLLKGLIILNSVPTLNSPEFECCATENNLPSRAGHLEAFMATPTLETVREFYLSIAPYCFPTKTLEAGTKLIESFDYSISTAFWWKTEGEAAYSTIKWIPKKIPVLIVGASHDFVTPISIFEQDKRFLRVNITITCIPNAGHFPWMEEPTIVRNSFRSFVSRVSL